MRLGLALLFLSWVAACSGDDDDTTTVDATIVTDAGESDGGVVPDAGPPDAGTEDSGVSDASARDAGPPDAGGPQFRLPGLSADVSVKFDGHGVLHVRCATDLDCFAAQGYFHAADRFPQMDIRRRAGTGRLAEVFGPLLLDTDRAIRQFIATSTGASVANQLWANASPSSRAMAEAYTVGVNAWIEDLRNGDNGAELPPEYRPYRSSVADWTPIDSVACILPLIENLTNQSGREISLGERFARLPPALAVDALGPEPASRSSVLPRSSLWGGRTEFAERLGAARDVRARLDHTADLLASIETMPDVLTQLDGIGSNNWALSGDRTTSGNAIYASDPHLGMSQPSVWYLVTIDSKSAGGNVHVAGASFAGLPGIIFGQNEDVAWGSTTTLFDMADVYIETLDTTGDAVMFNGQAVPILEVDHTFGVLGSAPVTETYRYVPHHGPVVAYDASMNMAVTIRWTGAEASTDVDFIWDMMTSSSVVETQTALRKVTTLGQNWVAIDRTGDIGWFPYNRVPNRPWASATLPPWLPLPGDGTAEWQGFVPYDQLPQAINPPAGFIATANNDMVGALADGDPTNDGQAALQHFVAPGFRHERILDRIAATGSNHTVATTQTLQADTHSLLGEQTVTRIVTLGDAGTNDLTPGGAAALEALRAWDFDCPTGLDGNLPDSPPVTDVSEAAASVGCTVFHHVWWRMFREAFGDELGAFGVSPIATDSANYRLLVDPSRLIGGASYWDDINTPQTETSTSVVVRALNNSAAWLVTNVDPSADEWRWGRIHTLTLRPDVIGAMTPRHNNGPFCSDGGLYTVDVANPGGRYRDEYEHRAGVSMRLVCESESTGMVCTFELPGGQSSLPTSPNYDDLLLSHLEDVPNRLLFSATEIDAAAVREVVVRPRP